MEASIEGKVYRDVCAFVRGTPVKVHPQIVSALLRNFQRVSESRRGYVVVVGHWLVRLTEEDDGWIAQRLPQCPAAALSAAHLHSVSPVTLADGWEILYCPECGREW
jgi:hypothetical protein